MNIIPIITLTDPQKGLQKRHASVCWLCYREKMEVQDLTLSNRVERADGLAEIPSGLICYRIRVCPSCVSLLHAVTTPEPKFVPDNSASTSED